MSLTESPLGAFNKKLPFELEPGVMDEAGCSLSPVCFSWLPHRAFAATGAGNV